MADKRKTVKLASEPGEVPVPADEDMQLVGRVTIQAEPEPDVVVVDETFLAKP